MLEQYYRIDQAVGISIHISTADSYSVNACGVVIKNNQLHLQDKITNFENIGDLGKELPADLPIAVNLSGKGILQKVIDKIEEIDQTNFWQILPNANLEDFYIQNFVSNDKSFISIIRKSDAHKWLSLFTEQGFKPFMLSLGAFPVKNIEKQLNVYGEEIVFDGHVIQRDERSEWLTYSYRNDALAPFPIKIETDTIDEKLVLPYAASFQLVLADRIQAVKANASSIESDLFNYLTDRKLKVKGVIALTILFFLLLINFFVFTSLNAKNAELAAKLSVSTRSTSDMKGVDEEVKSKEALLADLGWDGGVNKSILIDQIASLLPAGVSWTELKLNPLIIGNSSQPTSLFANGKIRISGNADQVIPVNEWLARIKTKKWVKNAQLDSYSYNSELETGQFVVLIDF